MVDDKQKDVKPGLNIVTEILNGNSLGDIYQSSKFYDNAQVFLPPIDQMVSAYAERGVELTNEDAQVKYNNFGKIKEVFENRGFDWRIVNKDYNKGHNKNSALRPWFNPDVSFAKSSPSNDIEMIGVDKSILLEHSNQIAKRNDVFITKENIVKPLSDYYKGEYNKVETRWNEKVNDFVFQEIGDGELADPDKILTNLIVGGARDIESGLISSIYRGAVAGLFSKTINAGAGALRLANAAISGIDAIGDKRDFNEIYANSALNRTANDVSNNAASLYRANWNESQGAFDNANSVFFHVADGIGQLGPTIASGYLYGALGIARGAAMQLSILPGSLTVFDLTHNDLIRKGYTEEEAIATATIFASLTQLSENIFQSQLIASMGYKAGIKASRKVSMDMTTSTLQNLETSQGRKLANAKLGTIVKDARRQMPNRGLLNNKLTRNLRGKYYDYMNSPNTLLKVGVKSTIAGTEEGSEEVFEDWTQSRVAKVFNKIKRAEAQVTLAEMNGEEYDKKLINGQVIVRNADGKKLREISVSDREKAKAIKARAEKIVSGEISISEDFSLEGAGIAFISSFLTFGAGGAMSLRSAKNQKAADQSKVKMARIMLEDREGTIASIHKNIDDLVDQKIIDAGLGENAKTTLVEELMLTAEKIDRFGLNDPQLLETIGDDNLFFELYDALENGKNIQSALDFINDDSNDMKLPENIDIVTDLLSGVDNLTPSSKPEDFQTRLDEIDQVVNSITTKKENLFDKDINIKTSHRFTEKMMGVYATEALVKREALRRATNDLKLKLGDKYEESMTPSIKSIQKHETRLFNDTNALDFSTRTGMGAWKTLETIVNDIGPLGEQRVRETNKLIAEEKSGDQANFTAMITRLGELSSKSDFKLPALEITTTTTDKEGNKTAVDKTLSPAHKGTLESTIDEILKRHDLAIKEGVESQTSEYIKGSVLTAVKDFSTLVKSIHSASSMANYSDESRAIVASASGQMSSISNISEMIKEQPFNGLSTDFVLQDELAGLVQGLSDNIFDIEELGKQQTSEKRALTNEESTQQAHVRDYFNKFLSAFPEDVQNSIEALSKEAKSTVSELVIGFLNYQKVGPNKASLQKLMGMLTETIGNANAPIADQTETLAQIQSARQLLEEIKSQLKYIDDLASKYVEELPVNEGREHSIFQQENGKHRGYIITDSETRAINNVIKGIEKNLEAWAGDQRIRDADTKRANVYIQVGDIMSKLHYLDTLAEELTSNLHLESEANNNNADLIKQGLSQIAEIVRETFEEAKVNNIKVDGKTIDLSQLNNESIKVEMLYTLYHMAERDANGNYPSKELVKDAIIKVENIRLDLEESLAGQVSAAQKEVVLNDRDHAIGQLESFKAGLPIYKVGSVNYDGQISRGSLNEGRDALRTYQIRQTEAIEKWRANKTKVNNDNIEAIGNSVSGDALDNANTYRYSYYKYLDTINKMKPMSEGGPGTRRELLAAAYTMLGLHQGSTVDVITYEQLDILVEVLVFLRTKSNTEWENGQPEYQIPETLLARGLAGTGKTKLLSVISVLNQVMLEGKQTHVTYVVLNDDLKAIHTAQLAEMNTLLNKMGFNQKNGFNDTMIDATFVYAHEISHTNVDIKAEFDRTSFIIYEEGSTLEPVTYDPLSTGASLAELQKEYKKKLLFLGDEGQVRSLNTAAPESSIDRTGNKTRPLSQVFRTAIASIRTIQEHYRQILTSRKFDRSLPEVKYLVNKEGSFGVQYVGRGSQLLQFREVVTNFLAAKEANPSKNIILLLPTYVNKREVLEHNPGLNIYDKDIRVMAYDARDINITLADAQSKSVQTSIVNWNASGISADMVFVPFSLESMTQSDGTSILSPIKDNSQYDSVTIMLTGVSRSAKFVQMVGDESLSEDVGENGILNGYNTSVVSAEEKIDMLDEARGELRYFLKGIGVKDVPIKRQKPDSDMTGLSDMRSDMSFEGDNSHSEADAQKAYETVANEENDTEKRNNVSSESITKFGEKETQKNDKQQKRKAERKTRENLVNLAFAYKFAKTIALQNKAKIELDQKVAEYRKQYEKGQKVNGNIKKTKESDEAYAARLKGYTANLINLADLISARIGFSENNYSVFRPTMKGELNGVPFEGHPFSMNVIGYKKVGDKVVPIVDIYTLQYNTTEMTSNSIEAMAHMYRALAESKGYLVRKSNVLKLVDRYGAASTFTIDITNNFAYSVGPTTTVSYSEVLDALGLKTDIDYKTKLQNLEKAMFNNRRHMYSLTTSTGEVYYVDDTVIDGSGKKWYIQDILVDNKGTVIRLLSKNGTNSQDVSMKFLEANQMNTTRGFETYVPKSSSQEFSNGRRRLFSQVFQKAINIGNIPKDSFFDRTKNPLFNIKLTILENLKNLTEKTIERKYEKKLELQMPTRRGVKDLYIKSGFAFRLNDSQVSEMEEILSKAIQGYEKGYLTTNGLDLIGIETPSEYKSAKSINYSKEDALTINNTELKKLTDRGTVKAVASQLMWDNFSLHGLLKEEVKKLVTMNLTKFMEEWDVLNNNIDETTYVNINLDQEVIMPTEGRFQDLYSAISQMSNDGYDLLDTDANTIYDGKASIVTGDIDKTSGKFKSWVTFKHRLTRRTVRVPVQAKRVLTNEDATNQDRVTTVLNYLDFMATEFSKEKASYKVLIKELDDLYATETRDLDAIRLQKAVLQKVLFNNGEFVQFLNANKKTLVSIIKGSNTKDKSLLTALEIMEGDKHKNYLDIRVKGNSYSELVMNIPKAIKQLKVSLGSELAHYDSIQLYKPIVLEGDEKGNYNKLLISNGEVNLTSVNQGVIYSSEPKIEEKPETSKKPQQKPISDDTAEDEDEVYDKEFVISTQYNFVSKEQALNRVVELIGDENAKKYLGFNNGIIIRNGRQKWGEVRNGLMRLALLNSGVEQTSPDHESLHFAIEYLMGKTQRDKLMTAAAKKMGGNPTYADVHENLAKMFEYDNYKPTTFIGKILDTIKKSLFKNFNLFSNDILTILGAINDGHYANREVQVKSGSDTVEFFKDVESEEITGVTNEYTVDEVFNAKAEKFGSIEFIDYWAEKTLAPMIDGYSDIGKTYIGKVFTKGGLPNINHKIIGANSFDEALGFVYKDFLRMNLHFTKKFGKGTDGMKYFDGEVKTVHYGEITVELFRKLINFNKEQKRRKAIGTEDERYYFADNINIINKYVIQELNKKEGVGNPISGKSIFMNLAQGIYTEVNLAFKSNDGSPVRTRKENIAIEKDTVSPSRNMSTFLMTKMNATRLRSYSKTIESDKIAEENPELEYDYYDDSFYGNENYMNGGLVFNQLLIIGDQLRDDGQDINIKNILSRLKEKRRILPPGSVIRNNIHTFLVEFGDEMSNEVIRIIENGDNYEGQKVSSIGNAAVSLSGIGYGFLVNKLATKLGKEELTNTVIPETHIQQIVDKADFFRDVTAMIESSVRGLISARRTYLKSSSWRTDVEFMKNDSAYIYFSTMRDAIRNQFSSGNSGFVQEEVWKDFLPGENQKFKVTKESLSMNISKAGEEAAFVTVISKTRKGDIVYNKDLHIGIIKNALNYITVTGDVTNDNAEIIMSHRNSSQELLEMFQYLHSAILNSRDFKAAGGFANEVDDNGNILLDENNDPISKTVFNGQSDETLAFDEILAEKEADTYNRNPLGLMFPTDKVTFIRDVVAPIIASEMSRTNDSIQVMRDGTTKQTRETETYLYDKLSSDDVYGGASIKLVRELKEEAQAIQASIVENNSKPVESAIVTITKNKIIWRDPLMNGLMKLAPLGSFVSIESPNAVFMDSGMGLYEYLRAYRDLIKEDAGATNNMHVFVEGLGDRTKIPQSKMAFGDDNLFSIQKNKGKITMMSENPILFVNTLKHFVASQKMREEIGEKRWKSVTKLKVTDEVMLKKGNTYTKNARAILNSDLEEFSEYKVIKKDGVQYIVIGDNYKSEDSPYRLTKEEHSSWNSLLTKFESGKDKLTNARQMLDIILPKHEGRIKALESSLLGLTKVTEGQDAVHNEDDIEMTFTTQRATAIKNVLDSVDKFISTKLGEENEVSVRIAEINAELKEMSRNKIRKSDGLELFKKLRDVYNFSRDSLSEEDKTEFKSKFWKNFTYSNNNFKTVEVINKETGKVTRGVSVYNQIFTEKFIGSTQSVHMSKLMYWNHHIFNQTINNLLRGPVDNFGGIQGYQKRGKQFDAIGKNFSEAYVGKTLNSLVVNDMMISNPIFSKKLKGDNNEFKQLEETDGLVAYNSVLHELTRMSKGSHYGDITTSSQKNLLFDYSPIRGSSILNKSSMFAPRFDKFSDPTWRSIMLTMYGEVWDTTISDEATYTKWVKKTARKVVSELSDPFNKGVSPTMAKMVHLIEFKSTRKTGARREIEMTTDEAGNQILDTAYNSPEHHNILPAKQLRHQLHTGNFTWDNNKSIPTQIMYTVGVGEHNRESVQRLNKHLSDIANIGVRKYEEVIRKGESEEFVRELGIKKMRGGNSSVKSILLANDRSISLDTWSGEALSALASHTNKFFKPTMPGSSLVQIPHWETIYQSRDGRIYTESTKNGRDITESRKLAPLMFWKKNVVGEEVIYTPYTDIAELLEDAKKGKILTTPQELIMPFVHQHKFGIKNGTTLAELFTVSFYNNEKKIDQAADLRTSRFQQEHSSTSTNLLNLEKMFSDLDYEEIITGTNSVGKYVHQDIVDYLLNSELKNREFEYADEQEKRSLFLNALARYYTGLNNALDVFSVRVPTTGPSSGFPSRIIEIKNEYDNTVFASSEKNILDGSDYDIDELHIFHKPLLKDLVKEKKRNAASPKNQINEQIRIRFEQKTDDEKREILRSEEGKEALVSQKERDAIYEGIGELNSDSEIMFKARNGIFTEIYDYYYKSQNIEAILREVTTDTIEEEADKQPLGEKFTADLISAMELRDISIAGKELVGHYANLQNAISRMLQIADKSVFAAGTFTKQDRPFKEVLDLIGRISEMINAATDNDSLGGALGKIGFTSYTSQVISGMILYDKSLEDIIEVTTSQRFRDLENAYKKRRFNGFASSNSLKALLLEQELMGDVAKLTKEQKVVYDELTGLIEYNIAGEKIRRYATIIGLQQGIKGTSWGIYSKTQEIETILGQSLDSFTDGEISSQANQLIYLENFKKDNISEADKQIENLVRDNSKAFDLQRLIKLTPQLDAYINILNSTNAIAEEAFNITPNTPFVTQVLEKAGTKVIFKEKVFKALMNEATKVSLATFLNEKYGSVTMNGSSYNMAKPEDKSQFVIDFVDYIKVLRKDTRNRTNALLHGDYRLRKKETQGDIPIYNLHASNGASKETLMTVKENGFDMLYPEDKKIFRIYNLLVYGLSRKDGNLTGVVDNLIEQEYSDWIKETKSLFGEVNPIEVLTRAPNLVSQTGKEYYSYIRNGYSVLGVQDGFDENKKAKYMPFSTPFSSMINTYPIIETKTTHKRNTFNGLKLKELKSLKLDESTYISSFQHGVQKGNRDTTNRRKSATIYNGDTVYLKDGSTAVIERSGKDAINLTLLSRPDAVSKAAQTHKASGAMSISSNQAESLVTYMVTSLNKLFPNLDVFVVNNDNAELPGTSSWISKSGVVYINRDLITPETRVHEIRHLYLAILRQSSMDEYNNLRTAVMTLLKNKDAFALKIYNEHKYLGNDASIEEVMVYFMDIKDLEQLENDYDRIDEINGKENARSIWGTISDLVKKGWDSIYKNLKDALGFKLDTDIAHETLLEFAQKSLAIINSGQLISNVSSEDVSMLLHGIQTHKPKSITSVSSFFDWVFSSDSSKTVREEQFEEKLFRSYNDIVNRGGEMSKFYTGRAVRIPLSGLEYNSPAVVKFTKDREVRENKLNSNTIKILKNIEAYNNADSKQEFLDVMYGTDAGVSIVNHLTFKDFLQQIGYTNKTIYKDVNELDEFLDTHNTVPVEFKESGIIVAVKFHSDQETLISLIDMNNDVILDRGEAMFSALNDNSRLSMKNIRLKKNKKDRAGVKLQLLSNMIMVNNKKVKVQDFGFGNMFSNQNKPNSRNFYRLNPYYYNNQLARVGEIKAFMALLSNPMKAWFQDKNIITPEFSHPLYLDQLYSEEKIEPKGILSNLNKKVNELTVKERGDFYVERLWHLVDEYKRDGDIGGANFYTELNILRAAVVQSSQANVYRREINTHESINTTERKLFGVQNLGEVNNTLVQEEIIKAEKKIAEKVSVKRDKVHAALEALRVATGKSKGWTRGYSALDSSKDRYEMIYDTITVNGKEWRTGGIYYTNKVVPGMHPKAIELAQRAKEKKIPEDVLKAGKMIVDIFEDLMVENIYNSNYTFEGNYGIDKETGEKFTMDMAREQLSTNSVYYRGFIPIMRLTADEKLSTGNILKSWTHVIRTSTDIETMMEDSAVTTSTKEENIVTLVQDRMFSQIGYGIGSTAPRTMEYGTQNRVDMLGIKNKADSKGKPYWDLIDPKANTDISYNIENTLAYFTVATVRKPIFEQEVLPIINATVLYLQDQDVNRGSKTAGSLKDHIMKVRDFQILNRRTPLEGGILGFKYDRMFGIIQSISLPAVMALNMAVPIVSASSNLASAFAFGLANRMSGSNLFTDKELAQAAKKLLSKERKLITGIALKYGVTDSTEYEMVHLSTLKLYDKKLISNYMVNYPNRRTDIESRKAVMVAQMLKDGSYYAHSLKDGEVVYDKKKDERWKGPNGKALLDVMEKRMDSQGLSIEDRGYDYQTANTFKALGDMFSVGEFDKNTSNQLASYSFGKMALGLNKYLFSRWQNAFGANDTFRVQGEVLVMKEIDGKLVPIFEKLSGEGYANTWWKYMMYMVKNVGNEDRMRYSELETWQKTNIHRFGINVSAVALSSIIASLFSMIKIGDDDDDTLDNQYAINAMLRGVNSLVTIGNIISLMTRPFAGMQIIKNAFVDDYGDPHLSKMINLVPGYKGYELVDDWYEDYTGDKLIPF